MPRGYPLSESQKRAIYNAFTSGEKQADIAATYGVTANTISKIVSQQRKAGTMASREKIVAGDKRNGRLVSSADINRYEGTCVVNGKAKSKTFIAVNAHMAQKAWEKWCQELRDEQKFMDMVERKVDAVVEEAGQEDKAVCGYPSDPIEEIHPIKEIDPAPEFDDEMRPWRDVAEERRQRIEELEKRVEFLEGRVEGYESDSSFDKVIVDTEGEKPKLGHWFNDNGSFRVMWMDKPVYVLWAKGEKPKIYGVFWSLEIALKELDKLNELAAFLDKSDAFEVEEAVWR